MIDSLFAELATNGWLVNNMYQHDDGSWRINLRKPKGTAGDWFTSWAEAPTLLEALEDSMSKLAEAEYFDAPAVQSSIDRTPKPPPRSLASILGLIKPAEPINRRI